MRPLFFLAAAIGLFAASEARAAFFRLPPFRFRMPTFNVPRPPVNPGHGLGHAAHTASHLGAKALHSDHVPTPFADAASGDAERDADFTGVYLYLGLAAALVAGLVAMVWVVSRPPAVTSPSTRGCARGSGRRVASACSPARRACRR